MADEPDWKAYKAADHLRVTEKMLRLIEHLGHGPNSCDHKLVQAYALQALSRLQAARRDLGVLAEHTGLESGETDGKNRDSR